jgi:FKBP-type peptidyl-prolyl cis-trans isomerase 2
MKIAPGTIVKLEYEIRIKGGDVIESSAKSGPVQYVHGEGKMLPALEKRLEGLAAGQSLEGVIPAAEAGPPEETLPTRAIPKSEFPKDVALEAGSLFEAHTATGGVVDLRIISVDERHVTARMLPPLFGKDLAFKVRVMMIEDPVSHRTEIVKKKAPPLPGAALKLEVEPDDD